MPRTSARSVKPVGGGAEHGNGHSWQVVRVPAQGGRTFAPYAAAVSGPRLVGVGTSEDDRRPRSSLAFTVADGHAATTATQARWEPAARH
jgi:hypothetical protein